MADGIHCHWILLAKNVEEIESKFNILGIFNAITPDRVPFTMPHAFHVVSSWSGPRNTKATYTLRGMSDEEGETSNAHRDDLSPADSGNGPRRGIR